MHQTIALMGYIGPLTLTLVDDRVFPVAAVRTLNSLSQHVTSTSSMSVLRGHLRASLYQRSFP